MADLGVLVRQLQEAVFGAVHEPGDLKLSAAAVPQAGWLLCDGATYNTVAHPKLAAALGAGGSTFTVPDFRGRAPVGAGTGAGLTARTLAATGGTEAANMPSHDHGGVTGGPSSMAHTHGFTALAVAAGAGSEAWTNGGTNRTDNGVFSGAGLTHTHTIASAGGGADNMPPFRVVNVFIKA